jgi:rhodanese-related sulfurtransferase
MDGDEVDLGGLRLQAMATPGHTPEHLSYVLFDGEAPTAVFTGGALLPGGAARTDLIDPESTEPLARALYRSIRERLLTLPDATPVYPTHGAGSFCSVPAGGERVTTIGRERETNPLLTAKDEDDFVREVLDGFGTYPSYFGRMRELNRNGPALFGPHPPLLQELRPDSVQRLVHEGAELIDVRPIRDFGAGHIPGALSIRLRPAFASWLGWLVPEGRSLIFVLNADQDRDDLVRQCLKVGYEDLAGELAGGMAAWREAGLEDARVDVEDIAEVDAGAVIDVRQANEYASGHLPGALHVELGALRGADDLPPGPLTLMCGHGERDMTGASLLEREGWRDLVVLQGGAGDWSKATGRQLAVS